MGLRRLGAVLLTASLLTCAAPTVGPATGVPDTAAAEQPSPPGVRREPTVRGPLRFGATVHASAARFDGRPRRVRWQWLRSGTEIAGATGRAYRIQPADVGSRLQVRATASIPGLADAVATSPRGSAVRHRRDVRRTVTYHVETRGAITTSVRDFAALAAQTYADARGWRGSGVAFERVARGGSFTLVLAAAAEVPRFSGACSSTYSCRVGRYVMINQTRWLQATPSWSAAGGSLRDYRHLVVNHETGHWLGLGHAGCGGRGALAPVMMQQSKGLDGCRFNPWPTPAEVASRSPR